MKKVDEKALVASLVSGDKAAAAILISAIEDDAEWLKVVWELLTHRRGMKGACRLGITGAPGVGKSTLVGKLLNALLEVGHRIGVLAVDPSSPITGGAVLGDRLRMNVTSAVERCFIRSLGTRGQLGGLTEGVDDIIEILEKWGADIIIIESVGVGQTEVEIGECVDIKIVLLQPGTGDSIQLMKAGVMESGDIFIVNKADIPGAERLVSMVTSIGTPEMRPTVLKTVAETGEGIDELIVQINERCTAGEIGLNRDKRDSNRAKMRLAREVGRLCESEVIRQNSENLETILDALKCHRRSLSESAEDWLIAKGRRSE